MRHPKHFFIAGKRFDLGGRNLHDRDGHDWGILVEEFQRTYRLKRIDGPDEPRMISFTMRTNGIVFVIFWINPDGRTRSCSDTYSVKPMEHWEELKQSICETYPAW